MILNVSGRTDIPAFYSQWFINRCREGYLYVRNPFEKSSVSKIDFNDVDLIVFCSKNPKPIIKYLEEIKQKKPILFHVTLTPYKKDIEPNVPDKTEVIESIKEISKILGAENVFVRYDPMFLSEKYNVSYHIKAFDKMCKLLKGHVKKIIISFIDDYKNVRNNSKDLKLKEFTKEDYKQIGENFSRSAEANGMTVQTCSEEENLSEYGFIKGECISKELATKLTGKRKFKKWTARNQKYCNCVEMVDIGVYNSCMHLCKYCYANYDEKEVKGNVLIHDENSPFQIGELLPGDMIRVRKR